ncbi:MAG: PAS domain-containing protein [Firmicutes bacterium]|jgi:predicted transcriptional regulator YheO|nr:PAS domain-containing protein [Bacillota bacterium]
MDYINRYIPLIKFISEFLGSDVEVVLSDAKKMKIVYVSENAESTLSVGDAIRTVEEKFITEKLYEKSDYISNYRAIRDGNTKLRSSTYFIKDEEGTVLGLITMNLKVDKYIDFRDILDKLVNGESNYSNPAIEKTIVESFEPSFDQMMSEAISEVLSQYNTAPERMTVEEKMEIIQKLDKRGTFLIKGSIGELAKAFDTTETTIYRYINRLSE